MNACKLRGNGLLLQAKSECEDQSHHLRICGKLALSQRLSPLDLSFRFSILLPKYVCRLPESSKHINYLQFSLSKV